MKSEIQAYLVLQEQAKAKAEERARWLKVLGKPRAYCQHTLTSRDSEGWKCINCGALVDSTPAGWWTTSYDRKGRLIRMFVPAK